MMRSMYSAVSGLRAHQTKMDVIGNNIANINTVGYKKSQVAFQDLLNQLVRGAGAPQDGKGGTNPQQVGLGVGIGSINTIQTQGNTQATDSPTDVMIDGEGFFVVTDDTNFENRYYTRAGNFTFDRAGNLVTADGYKVLGYGADEDGNITSEIRPIVVNRSETVAPTTTRNIQFDGNLDSRMDLPYEAVETQDASGKKYKLVLNNDGIYKTDTIIRDSLGNGYKVEFEISKKIDNVNGEFLDADGNWKEEYNITLYDTKEAALADLNHLSGQWQYRVLSIKPEGSDGKTITPADTGFQDLAFSSEGKLTTGSSLKIKIEGAETGFGEKDGSGNYNNIINVHLSQLHQYADDTSAKPKILEGNTAGVIEGFSISPNGEVVGQFSNGEKKTLGQLILAKFDNSMGLQKLGGNLFTDTRNSGEPQVGKPGASGYGSTKSGSLEMSNVDISMEFTEMITTERGFQANSRIITTSDEMLQELVNMKR